MSFIIETNGQARDNEGRLYGGWLGPFMTRKDADFWALINMHGEYEIHELTDPRSLRRA